MVKLAIFDMDGTLIDTLTDLAAACNHVLRRGGFPEHSIAAYRDFIGRGPLNLVRDTLPEESRDDITIDTAYRNFLEYYSAHSQDCTKPYDGVTEAIKMLRAAGVRIAVCSNKPHNDAVAMSEAYFPGLIDMTVGSREGAKLKPDPESGLRIMRHFGMARDETVYIGDSGVDMQTGRNLGVTTIGVSWGFRPKSELKEQGADVIIDKAGELPQIILDKMPVHGIY